MILARSITLRTATLILLGASAAFAQVNVGSLADDGWYSDDTRADGSGTQLAGTNLKSPVLTDAPESGTGNSLHDADIFEQIMFGDAAGVVPAGTWQGAANLFIDVIGGAAGKSTISHRKDDATGHGPGSAFGPGFTAQYSWMGNGPSVMTAALKFGIKTADFATTGVSSRTGENAWDKILIYEPINNTNSADGLWHTEAITHTSGKWWFFDRKVSASSQGTPMELSAMNGNATVFSGIKTIGDVYALITAPGAKITSVQFGIGSNNAGANVYVNQFKSSAYLGNAQVTFGAPHLLCDENVTPDVIFGGGNINGSYTVARHDGVEVGMRGKLRYPSSNIFNSNGDGTYTFHTGTGGGPAGNSEWSFEWSVNTDYDGANPSRDLGDMTYEIGMDNDPGPGTNYLVFDPISIGTVIPYTVPAGPIPYWDHSVGDNTTGNGAGLEAGDGPTYSGYLATKNVAQNSWRPIFYQNTAPYSWNPNLTGRYEYYLSAKESGIEVARSHITIVVVPTIAYDQLATPDQIQGSGVTNGSYTTARVNGLELGMRGKLRYLLGVPANIYNSNGDGTYTFNTGTGGGPAGNSEWSFEFAVNTDYDGSQSTREVGDLTYEIGMDNDPGGGTNYLVFDPISIGTIIPYTVPVGPIPFWDHDMGDNTTGGDGGLVAPDAPTYTSYLAIYNVAQNSWRPTFYQNTAPYSWNPNTPGRYEYYVAARSGSTELARSAITIIATNGSTMVLEADPSQTDQDCDLPGTQIKLRLYDRNLDGPINGYQTFLDFNPAQLTYVGAASSYSAEPFETHVQSTATANVSPGKLRLDGTSFFGGSTSADNLLATLVFTVLDECSTTAVTFDLGQPFPNQFSQAGSPVTTALINPPLIFADDTPPVLAQPPNVTVAAEAGVGSGCTSAVATFPAPAASDNCTGAVTVVSYPPSGSTFPVGTTTVTTVATDAAGNTATRTHTVTVTPTNQVNVSIQLVGVSTATVRCIRFQTNACAFTDVPLAFNASGLFTGTVEIPCGAWTSLCVKDRQHTKWFTTPLTVSGGDYNATLTVNLDGGDTDNDGDVDIHDVTWLINQFGGLAASGGCPWNGTTRDADFSNNGAVGSEDYAFQVASWLTVSSCLCSPLVYTPSGPLGFNTAVAVHDAATQKADLDRNDVVDWRDVALFEQANNLPNQLSEAIRMAQPAR